MSPTGRIVPAGADPTGTPVYHTNVMMSVATEFALICSQVIVDPARRDEVLDRLAASGREVIDIGWDQVQRFAGNVLEVTGSEGRHLALSERALNALSAHQIEAIEHSCRLLPIRIPTIELAGGSVRCMLAGVHLTPRQMLDVAVAFGKAPSRAALVASALQRDTRLGFAQREPGIIRKHGVRDDVDALVDGVTDEPRHP